MSGIAILPELVGQVEQVVAAAQVRHYSKHGEHKDWPAVTS